MKEKIILGTVQFGLDYGINSIGQPTQKEVFDILNFAWENGIRVLDTAEGYGNAIDIIGAFHEKFPGKRFKVIMKFHVKNFTNLNVQIWVEHVLERLRLTQLEICMFHSFKELLSNKIFSQQLNKLKEQDLVKSLGVSVYENKPFSIVNDNPIIDVIQFPFNLLDNYKRRKKYIDRAKSNNKILHARSVFLQGLFFKPPHLLPNWLLDLKPALIELENIAKDYTISLGDMALYYALAFRQLEGVLIGVDSKEQLAQNISSIEKYQEYNKDLITAVEQLEVTRPDLLNPVNWSKYL